MQGDDSGVAQDGGHTAANRLIETGSLDQYHLTIFRARWPSAGFRLDRRLVTIIAGLFGSRLTVTQD